MVEPRIVDAFELAREVYRRPEVRFLEEKQHGPFILAVFSSLFGDGDVVLVEEFHELVDAAMGVLRDRGEGDWLPAAGGRTLCLSWMQQGWLDKDSGQDGRAVYRPSGASQNVRDWLTSQSRRRIVSAPRVGAIFDTVARLASLASPDREVAIAEHRSLARFHAAEVERLMAGGEVERGTDDDLLFHTAMVAEAMDQIPSDFRRVGDQFGAEQRRIREAMLTGDDGAGRVMVAVSEAARRITSGSVEGRAFSGVADLIRDDATMSELRLNVARIMASPVADLLTEAERVMFANIASAFVANVDLVLHGPRAMTRLVAGRLADHISTGSERAGLSEAIRNARAALLTYDGPLPEGALPTLGPLPVAGSSVRLNDPRPLSGPRPLSETPPSTAQPLTEAYLRRWGGPHKRAVTDHVQQLLREGHQSVTLAQAWSSAPVELRRSVELLPYFELAAALAVPRAGGSDTVVVVEGDRTREFSVPRIEFEAVEPA